MAPHEKIVSIEDVDCSYLESSPDPLAISVNTAKTKGRPKAPHPSKQPLALSSPSKQNRKTSAIETIEHGSPSKSMVLNTGRPSGASPWRIRVTVEAEPGSDEENMESPTIKRVTRTKTTTVPLKDADASSPVKRRGRPRKSDAASAKAKRSSTPGRAKAKNRARSSSAGADASAADMDTDAPPKRRRGRPRKTVQLTAEDRGTLVEKDREEHDATGTTSGAPTAKERGTAAGPRETLGEAGISRSVSETGRASPQEKQSRQTSVSDGVPPDPPTHKRTQETVRERSTPIAFTPTQTSLTEKIRTRKSTPAAKSNLLLEVSSDEESEAEHGLHTPSGTDEEGQASSDPNQYSLSEAIEEPAEQSFQMSEFEQDGADGAEELEGATNFAFEEGATRMPDDTTILESENFSMVSVDSLPSSGGLTSPPNAQQNHTPAVQIVGPTSENVPLKIPSVNRLLTQRGSGNLSRTSPLPAQATVSLTATVGSSPSSVAPRHKTPSVDPEPPAKPPPIQVAPPSVTKAETPKLGRVVKAGVALQGVVDPNRATPEAAPYCEKARDEQRDRLDDLFRGFSERTRRELQAGLRLGEQLALQGLSRRSSPSLSSPIKENNTVKDKALPGPADDIFAPQRTGHPSRLLTPEDHDNYTIASPPPAALPAEVQYPSLNVEYQKSHLISPAASPTRSEDEMSWKVDTPPVRAIAAEKRRRITVVNERGEIMRGQEIAVIADEDAPKNKEDYADIWQEEASRSSNSSGTTEGSLPKSPQLQDLFPQDGPIKPARGKLPRTWRRKSASDFQYSDESEEPQKLTPSSTESDEPAPAKLGKGKGKNTESAILEEVEEEVDNVSEASDDTGMFFQTNMPSLFNKRRSAELRKKKAEKLDLSQLMHEGASLLPESSPPVAMHKSPVTDKPNPFLDTPPRFSAFRSSPVKSSPLRQVVRALDSSSGSISQVIEESTLPLAPSSPFHTNVDGNTSLSTASDQRQLLQEMGGATDSSLRRIRNEADEYLVAYELQERTLNEIEEVTEPSRTWNKEPTIMPSSPPRLEQTSGKSMLSPKRSYAPLFGEVASSGPDRPVALKQAKRPKQSVVSAPPVEQPAPPSASVFSRLTSSLWSAIGNPAPPPTHPILAKLNPLPRIEPWTKTHYKTLDGLYQQHKKRPALFSPGSSSNTSNTNDALLKYFLRTSKRPFIGARYSVWGYSVVLDEPLVVVCAVYMQLLTLKDIFEYEKRAGKKIQMGDCGPGVTGEIITAEEVARRLASVIMGEELRRDEKKGKIINRSGTMTVVWPE